MKTRSLWIMAVCSLLLSACYKEIDLEQYRPKPTLVLNCVCSPDTVVRASVSRTVFFTDHREDDPTLTDATVSLTVNGVPAGTMRYDEASKLYVSDVVPQAGDRIEIRAVHALGEAIGTDMIPEQIPVERVGLKFRTYEDPDRIIVTPGGPVYGQSYEATYRITFTDPASERNYYCIRIENNNGIPAETLDYSHDKVFLAQQEIMDGVTTDTRIYGDEGRTFTDDLFDGQTYTMEIVQTAPYYGRHSRPYRIILYSLSEPYYHYLTGILNVDDESFNSDLVDWGFSEPNAYYSNVNGGTGIVGAVQCSVYTVDLESVMPAD